MFSLNLGLVRLGALAVLLFQLAGTSEARHLPANPQWTKLAARRAQNSPAKRAADATTFPVFNFTQPLDHFVDTGFTFQQRYWLSDRHYKPGGPVIVFEAGEGPGDERMPILDTGILNILANATDGLAIVLEHRYYGESVPVQNFTTDSLRWLNNEQAAADSANFIDNVTFPGIPGDLTAPGTPWIYYGGSYGGARAAHMRVLYPDLVFGAIASSGVVHATLDDWRYFDIIRQSAPAACITQVERTIDEVDRLITSPNAKTRLAIKSVFGLQNVTYDPDFASLLSNPLGAWQSNNWDPAVGSTSFARFCAALGTPDNATVHTVQGITVSNATFNYATYINRTISRECQPPQNQDECFGTITAPDQFKATDLSQTWRLWDFQVCTQWGFFMTPPPNPATPRIISKLITQDYASLICKLAYDPGEHFQVPPEPDVEAVNKLGGYSIAYDRLAIIDGQDDPWRGDTPHSPAARPRADTTLRPFKLIPLAVHHYDENGLADPSQEPPQIQAIHQQEIEFVKAWLKDFKAPSKP
ncbi:peptidase S28 [Trametes versicolor FP-101664 SS1]|uniref:peptidase S28 n=1 Tax=Trametes versicolor (strain FP-101664) TaxID=717944 RepID=UPI00046242C0|nr:peptidase S28 [Trametes versicolor FP-101664 SS1]EIW65216.1 peptidase S28 [Trametes versicolor FP-101664 SS1]